MSEKMTRITIPGQHEWSGLMDWGEREDMISQARTYAAHLRSMAELIEAAADCDFKIDVVRGRYAQHFVRNIQPGSTRLARKEAND